MLLVLAAFGGMGNNLSLAQGIYALYVTNGGALAVFLGKGGDGRADLCNSV